MSGIGKHLLSRQNLLSSKLSQIPTHTFNLIYSFVLDPDFTMRNLKNPAPLRESLYNTHLTEDLTEITERITFLHQDSLEKIIEEKSGSI